VPGAPSKLGSLLHADENKIDAKYLLDWRLTNIGTPAYFLNMKCLPKVLGSVGLALMMLGAEVQAGPKMVMYGSWSSFWNSEVYKLKAAEAKNAQTGRIRNLKRGFYVYGYLSGGDISNDGNASSGPLSLELWLTKRYNGKNGYIKATFGFQSLPKRTYYQSVTRYGYAKLTGLNGYDNLILWRKSGGKWKPAYYIPDSQYYYDGF